MSRRILVVEDEPRILELVGEVLSQEGYEVTQAANGALALQAVSAGASFDLAVIDMWMPVLNGWEFAAGLIERRIHISLVVMTAASDARAYASEVGAIGFIGKPFDLENLLRVVRNALPPTDDGPGDKPQPIPPPDTDRDPPIPDHPRLVLT